MPKVTADALTANAESLAREGPDAGLAALDAPENAGDAGVELRRGLYAAVAAHDRADVGARLLLGLRQEHERCVTTIIYHLYRQEALLPTLPALLADEVEAQGASTYARRLLRAIREHGVEVDASWLEGQPALCRRWLGQLPLPFARADEAPAGMAPWMLAEPGASLHPIPPGLGYDVWGGGATITLEGQAVYACPLRSDLRAKHATPTISLAWIAVADGRLVGSKKIPGALQSVHACGSDLLLRLNQAIARRDARPAGRMRWTREVWNLEEVLHADRDAVLARAEDGLVALDSTSGTVRWWNHETVPRLALRQGDRVYVLSGDREYGGRLHVLDDASGQTAFTIDVPPSLATKELRFDEDGSLWLLDGTGGSDAAPAWSGARLPRSARTFS